MAKLLTLYDPVDMRLARQRAQTRARRVAHEATTLALACVMIAAITVGLYLVAPPELRNGIVSAFLGFDQPAVTLAPRPPMSL